MARYTVQAPDGKTLTLEGPDGASQDEIVAQAQKLYTPPAPADHGALNRDTGVYADNSLHRNADGSLGAVADDVDDPITAKAKKAVAAEGGIPFVNAISAGIRSSDFGVLDHALAGVRTLTEGGSYADNLKYARAEKEAEAAQSTPGNILGIIGGSVASGGGAGKLIGAGAGRLASAASPVAQGVGNFLQSLMTLRKGQTVGNAAKLITAGAAQGAAQATGDGGSPITGAEQGAIGTAVLGGGFKAAQILTRPLRDVLRLSSAGSLLNRVTTATRDQLERRAQQYRDATGAEPTVFEILPLADRNKILSQAVSGRDNVVEATTGAIRQRAENLGTEMRARANQILDPRRQAIERQMEGEIANARGGTTDPGDAAAVAAASRSPTDMLALRRAEAQEIMGPHENTPVVDNLADLFPSVPAPGGSGARIATDPEVSAVIRAAAAGLRNRAENGGVNAGEISDMMTKLRDDLGEGVIASGTAQRAIDHLQDVLETNAPEAGQAARQMSDAYAARSRMAEGMQEGGATRLRNDVQVGTNDKLARKVRNAYDTPEGTAGRTLGQANRIVSDLGGTPEDALRSTVRLSRSGNQPQLEQNIGVDEAAQLMAAARAQDTSAQALAAAASKAQSGAGDTTGAEALVTALAGLHPGTFASTKLGVFRKLRDMSAIPDSRARAMVEMLFSQNPQLTQRAMNAISNQPNGAQFLQQFTRVVGRMAGSNAANPAPEVTTSPATPEAQETAIPDAEATGEPATPDPEVTTPPAPGQSPYSPQLQQIYDTESPEMLDLISRVSGQESGGNQFDASGNPITSSAGAVGIMQVLPTTGPEAARLAGVPWDENAYRNDPDYNKLIGIAYLSELLRKYDGDVAKATAAYNAGSGRVDDAVKKHGDRWIAGVPAETQNYVKKVA